MEAFFVVHKGDLVGVYQSLSDFQAQIGTSICDPPVSVYKGYSMPKDAESYLLSCGLKNALYSIRASDLTHDLFGTLVPCPVLQEKDESWRKESVAPLELWSSAKKNESVVPLIDPGPSSRAFDSVVRNDASQPPQKNRAFRMSVQEDSSEQDDDVHDNGIAPTPPLPEKKGPMEVPVVESNLSTAEEPKSVNATTQPEEVKSTSDFVFSKTTEFGGPSSGKAGESSGALAVSASEEASKALQSAVIPPPSITFDNPKDNPCPLISLSIEYSVVDYDVHDNGIAQTPPLPEEKGPMEAPVVESNLSTAEEPKSVNTSTQPEEVKLASDFVFSKTTEFGGPSSGKAGESGALAISASEEASKASQSAVIPPPSITFDNPKDNPPPVFSFSSNDGDEFPALPSQSSIKASEPKLDSSSSVITTSSPKGLQLNTPEPKNGDLNPKTAADKIEKQDTAPPAPNGPVISNPPPVSFNTTSSNDENQIAPAVGTTNTALSAPSISITSFTSTGTTDSISVSLVAVPSTSKLPNLSFTATYPSTSPSETSSTITSDFKIKTEIKIKIETNQSFGSTSNPTFPPFSAASSGISVFGLTSSATNSTPINPQTSPFNSATVPQGSSAQSFSSTSFPSLNTSTSTHFGFYFSNSHPSNPNPTSIFGNPSAFSSDSNSAKFGSTTSTNTIGSSTPATSSPFIFGGSSSTSTNAIGSGPAATSPFIFGTSSFASSSAPMNSATAPSNAFGSIFGGGSTRSTGFSFGATSSKPSTPTNNTSSSPIFPFSAQPAPSLQTPSQPVFGTPNFGFGASPGNKKTAWRKIPFSQPPHLVNRQFPLYYQGSFLFYHRRHKPTPFHLVVNQAKSIKRTPIHFRHRVVRSSMPLPASFSLGPGGGGDKSSRRICRPKKIGNRKK